MTFTNGKKIITNFKNGSPIGVRRLWNADGKLSELHYYFNETMKGHGWATYLDNYLVYQDSSFIINDIEHSIIVPLNKSQEILAGRFYGAFGMGILEDVHSVDVDISSGAEECILNISWKLKGKTTR